MDRVLFVINTFGRAGAEKALLELLRSLDPDRYEIHLYILADQGDLSEELPPYVKLLNRRYFPESVFTGAGRKTLGKTVCRRLFKRANLLRLLPYLLVNALGLLAKGRFQKDKLLGRVLSDGAERFDEEYDLAVAFLEGGSTYYVADHVRAKKKVAFVHVDYQMAGYGRRLDRGCYASFHRVFAVSEEVREAFLREYPELADKTGVFPNLINREEILEKAKAGEGFTDAFDGVRILSVGRLAQQKAYEISIDAMSLLKAAGESVRWYVLGEGELRTKLEKKIRLMGLEEDFLLLGEVENPYPYLREADIYVQASRFEGKSLAIEEAQILGRPTIVSDCSGNREQVKNGEDGLLCELTPEGISRRIQTLLSDPEYGKKLGEQAARKQSRRSVRLEELLSSMKG